MFIQTQATANPDVMKFLPGREVLKTGTANFRDPESAKRSPLAEGLFEVDSVIGVFLDADSITVTKGKGSEWQRLKPAILGAIMEHFMAGRPVLLDREDGGGDDGQGDVSEIVDRIEEVMNSRIRAAVAQSGGEIVFRGYEGGVVNLSSTSPAVLAGMRVGIENILRHYVPEVAEIRFLEHRPSQEENLAEGKPGLNGPEAGAILDLLDKEVNPAVAAHGGHIALVDVKDDIAYIRLEGGCQGCGMADVTLKQGVETAIKQAVPSIVSVLDTTDHAGGANPYYQPGSK